MRWAQRSRESLSPETPDTAAELFKRDVMTSLYLWFLFGLPALWLLARTMRPVRRRQLLFLAASYAFYLTFGWRFFVILIASSLFNFVWGGVIRRTPTASMLLVGLATNVARLNRL